MRKLCTILLFVLAACSPSTPAPKTAPAAKTEPATPPLPITGQVLTEREEALARARAEYEKNPNDAEAIIWLGRRTAYLGRYQEAIEIFSEGIRKHPRDARM